MSDMHGVHRTRGRRRRLVVLLLAVALLFLGAWATKGPRASSRVGRLEVVTDRLQQRPVGPFDGDPDFATGRAVPSGTFPSGRRVVYAREGRDWWAVVVVVEAAPVGPGRVMTEVYLFDKRWGHRTLLSDLPSPGAKERTVRPEWDPEGAVLAVYMSSGDDATGYCGEVGTVDPRSLRYRVLHRRSGGRSQFVPSGMARLLWRGRNSIILTTDIGSDAQITEVDTRSGATRLVYSERVTSQSSLRNRIDRVGLSPDGRLLAFDRWRSSPHYRYAGIWLLDLGTRRCQQITYEGWNSFDHSLLGFDSNSSLLFAATGLPRRVYRAHLVP